MKYSSTICFIVGLIVFLGIWSLISCKKKKCENDVYSIIQPYCPDGPSSCTNDLITVTGFMDNSNIYKEKFRLYSNVNKIVPQDNCLNTSFLEVYFPETDFSSIFMYDGYSYFTNFNVKVIIRNAKIILWNRGNAGHDDGNYLKVDSIQQIKFYKIEDNGQLTELIP